MRYQMDIKHQSKENIKKAFKGRSKQKNNPLDLDDDSSSERPSVVNMKNITFDGQGRTMEVK